MRMPRGGLLLVGVLALMIILAVALLPGENRIGSGQSPPIVMAPLQEGTADTLPWPEDPLGFLEGEWSGEGRWPDGTPFSIRSSFRAEGPHGYTRYEVVDLTAQGGTTVLWSGIMYQHEGTASLLLMDEGQASSVPRSGRVLGVEVEPGASVGVIPGRDARVVVFRSGEDEVTSVVEIPGEDEPWVELVRFVHTREPPPEP